jgi:hypothetical protein
MRRYFFDFRDGGSVVLDGEGVELATLQSVQAEAAQHAAKSRRETFFISAMQVENCSNGLMASSRPS